MSCVGNRCGFPDSLRAPLGSVISGCGRGPIVLRLLTADAEKKRVREVRIPTHPGTRRDAKQNGESVTSGRGPQAATGRGFAPSAATELPARSC